ncbi:hypothetical protein Vafri_16267 [Volvox africanus]|uniref:DNA 3'-5' helicase n=1 Tax=Volvox africanus TaxID=51714 RepID=A0A8J4F687_9CHLO|nr:hypothetical protein Vafri_16267 [Volvox africanus]
MRKLAFDWFWHLEKRVLRQEQPCSHRAGRYDYSSLSRLNFMKWKLYHYGLRSYVPCCGRAAVRSHVSNAKDGLTAVGLPGVAAITDNLHHNHTAQGARTTATALPYNCARTMVTRIQEPSNRTYSLLQSCGRREFKISAPRQLPLPLPLMAQRSAPYLYDHLSSYGLMGVMQAGTGRANSPISRSPPPPPPPPTTTTKATLQICKFGSTSNTSEPHQDSPVASELPQQHQLAESLPARPGSAAAAVTKDAVAARLVAVETPTLTAAPAAAADALSSGLTDEQWAVVRDRSAPVLRVLAGPGSGKTRTIIARVAELVQTRGVPPGHIALVTFTRKAAEELSVRLGSALGAGVAEVAFRGTFHSLSARLLRSYFHLADRVSDPTSRLSWLSKDFRIMEEEERDRIFMQALRREEGGEGPGERPTRGTAKLTRSKAFKELISFVKNRIDTTHGLSRTELLTNLRRLAPFHNHLGMLLEEHDEQSGDDGSSSGNGHGRKTELQRFLATLDLYDEQVKISGGIDFDDLVGLAVALMQQPEARRAAARAFRHILVDEFQDTNLPQYRLVRLLQSEGSELFLVGDSNQAIYTWRGALPEDIRGGGGYGGYGNMITAVEPPDEEQLLTERFPVVRGCGSGGDSAAAAVAASSGTDKAATPEDAVTRTAAGTSTATDNTARFLRRNHRSLPHIVEVAQRIINQRQLPAVADTAKQQQQQQEPFTVLEAVRDPRAGAAVAVVTTGNGRQEAAWVAEQIKRVVAASRGSVRLQDVAVLYRLNRQARIVEEALQAAGVPYNLPKSHPFWSADQVRDVAAFLRMAAAPLESSGTLLAQVLTRPKRGIDPMPYSLESRDPAASVKGEGQRASCCSATWLRRCRTSPAAARWRQ